MNTNYSMNHMNQSVSKSAAEKNWKILPWVVFGTGILYYCFAYLLRVYPSVMEHHLLIHFHVSVEDFGLITGFYYFAYAPMQLPVGVTVDRFGARRALLLGAVIACTGVFIFANTQNIHIALAGRFLIGLGAAFGYVTALKIASLWLPRRIFATAIGFLTGAGMLTASATDKYLTHLVQTTDFHSVLLFPAYIGVGLLVLILLFVRNKEGSNADGQLISSTTSYMELCRQLWGIMKMPQMWLIGLVGALLYLPSSVFVDAWAIPFLKSTHHFTAQEAATGALLTLTGWVISSFISGYLSDHFKTRKTPLMIAAVGSTIVCSIIIFSPISSHFVIYALLFTLGLFCGPHPLCFSLSKENCSHEISGTAVAFTNFVIMLGGMVLQPVVGYFLEFLSHAPATADTVYSNTDFAIALSVIPLGLLIAYFITLFIQETYGSQK